MDAELTPFKKGMILLWSGSTASIPAGWSLCNGAGDTPDLRNRFIVAAGDTYAVDATGGALTHTHEVVGNGHAHTMSLGSDIGSGEGFKAEVDINYISANTELADHKPPYYALAYIMKL